MSIPAEEPEPEGHEGDYAGPDYGQKGANRDPVPSEDAFDEEPIDYQQRGTGYVSPGDEQSGDAGDPADAGEDDA